MMVVLVGVGCCCVGFWAAVHSHRYSCLLGKGAVEFIFVQLVLWADHNCIATCQISAKTNKNREQEFISDGVHKC